MLPAGLTPEAGQHVRASEVPGDHHTQGVRPIGRPVTRNRHEGHQRLVRTKQASRDLHGTHPIVVLADSGVGVADGHMQEHGARQILSEGPHGLELPAVQHRPRVDPQHTRPPSTREFDPHRLRRQAKRPEVVVRREAHALEAPTGVPPPLGFPQVGDMERREHHTLGVSQGHGLPDRTRRRPTTREDRPHGHRPDGALGQPTGGFDLVDLATGHEAGERVQRAGEQQLDVSALGGREIERRPPNRGPAELGRTFVRDQQVLRNSSIARHARMGSVLLRRRRGMHMPQKG